MWFPVLFYLLDFIFVKCVYVFYIYFKKYYFNKKMQVN